MEMLEKINQTSAVDLILERVYKKVKEWEDAEKRGDDPDKIKGMDFSAGATCSQCYESCKKDATTGRWKPRKCSGCKAIIYCSKACKLTNWKFGAQPGDRAHKQLCASNKKHMRHVPYFRSEALKFPWARIEWDGSCSHDLLKARLGVLGSGIDFGYWSVSGGMRLHDGPSSISALFKDPVFHRAMRKPRKEPYTHGEVMLRKEWPNHTDAWKLKDEKDVPRLSFTKEFPPLKQPKYGQVKDWESWYAWRGLELKSPAALLMDFPLSVYHLLTKILDVVNPASTPSKRQILRVHYVGVEVELDFLPLFSELALLLPNTDLTLIFFGKVVHDLVEIARKRYPGSLATKDTVWSYAAPKETGGGTISIKLWVEAEYWTKAVLDVGEYPDAMVAMNAGLFSYENWSDLIYVTAVADIPFAITEYAEQSTDLCAAMLPYKLQSRIPWTSDLRAVKALSKSRSYQATINPFHRPGQRSIPFFRVPNVYNGFAMPVVTTTGLRTPRSFLLYRRWRWGIIILAACVILSFTWMRWSGT